MLLAKEQGEQEERCYAIGKWTNRPLLSYKLSSLVPPVAVTTFLPLAAKPSTLLPSSPEATSLCVAAHEWVKDESSLILTQLFPIWSLGLWATRWTTVTHILTYSHV